MMATADPQGTLLATSDDGRYRVRMVWDEDTYYGVTEAGEDSPYLDDDVWGYVVERLVVEYTFRVPSGEFTPQYFTPSGATASETWENVDSLWGIYGREEAEQLAREALAEVCK